MRVWTSYCITVIYVLASDESITIIYVLASDESMEQLLEALRLRSELRSEQTRFILSICICEYGVYHTFIIVVIFKHMFGFEKYNY